MACSLQITLYCLTPMSRRSTRVKFRCRGRSLFHLFVLFSAGVFLFHLYFHICVVPVIPSEESCIMAKVSCHRDKEASKMQKDKGYGPQVGIDELRDVGKERSQGKNSPCRKTEEESRFREVKRGIIAYSAWFDDRKSLEYVRILLLTSTREPLPMLFCHFDSELKRSFTSRVSYYQHSENHYMPFGCFIASCVVPPELDHIPCFVIVSTYDNSTYKTQTESSSLVLPINFIDRKIEKVGHKQYGICIPPLHGEISVDTLIEFLELSQILGASHFTFYNLNMSDSVQNVLDYYEEKGLARVLLWNLPSYIGEYDIHYYGQTLSIMDCLFRSMTYLDFVAFNDLDEFIVPLYHHNMSVLLKEIHHKEHCGHCFQSAIFNPSWEDLQISRLITQRVFRRTKEATPFWTKCIVDPRRIFEVGIHHISKPIEDNFIVDQVDWSVARVFHYRKCDDSEALMQPDCSGNIEEDKTMQKYEEQLQINFEMNAMAIVDFAETDYESV
ncbi:beta-1,4-galactosyltransferase galt-1-like [Stylophora pistillata]|uniref:beta-1,4-galactosyltransferase galt-1-like n=1 Tax=Stylophora pistillata TaxID=50429 RepID=UPI000C04441C|nr:beta-1,4-galactosyltransferase galt-1-like [Stylophora pistillata]